MSGKKGRAKPAVTAEADARNVFDYGLPLMLGVRVLEVSAERVTAELPVKREHFNRGGRVGGGVLMAMADAMGAAGSVMHRPDGYRGGTLESKTNFFSAAQWTRAARSLRAAPHRTHDVGLADLDHGCRRPHGRDGGADADGAAGGERVSLREAASRGRLPVRHASELRPRYGQFSFVQSTYRWSEWSWTLKPRSVATLSWRFSISES